MRTHLLMLLLFAAACGPDFAKQSAITRVRVLAVRAEPAEVAIPTQGFAPPPPVSFTALAVSPEDRPVAVRYALCRPANPFTPGFVCPGPDGFDLDGGVLDFREPGLEAYFLSKFDGGLKSATAAGGRPGGLVFSIGYAADDGTGREVGIEHGIRLVNVRQTDQPNQNPHFLADAGVYASLDGGVSSSLSLTALPSNSEVVLTPQLAPGSIETYSTPTGTAAEHLFYSWYATGDGGLEDLRSQEPVDGIGDRTSRYQTPAAAQRSTLFVVVRDDRGGTDWLIQPLFAPSGP